ncbi:hypothetical protein ACIBSV_15415 [Embleya sp. NPDC050154]|uniref:hypothetical protein n=1 Tax=Embleya sp. NPDC050154 TaxID=3363988 RepID=UPI0037AFC0EC
MAISLTDRKRLWARSGNQCAFPGCLRSLTGDLSDYSKVPGVREGVALGEEAHIVAESDTGPRANPGMAQSARDAYANIILLCGEHHKVVDAAGGRDFSVEVLLTMKYEHEKKFVSQGVSPQAEAEAAQRAEIFVSEWERRVELACWEVWTSWLLTPSPVMDRERFDRFSSSARWFAVREWPSMNFPEIQRASKIFCEIWQDLIGVIDKEFRPHRIISDRFCLHEKHKDIPWDPQLYRKYGDEYNFNCDLIHNLVFHLTAAANLLCESVRGELDANYRFSEGRLMISRGLTEDLGFEHFSPIYSTEQRASGLPYPGFRAVRASIAQAAGRRP